MSILNFKFYDYVNSTPDRTWIEEYWWIVALAVVAVAAIVFAFLYFRNRSERFVFVSLYKSEKAEMLQIKKGSTFNPDIPTREGYAFRGWYLDSACTTPWLSTYKVKKNMALYPKWEKE